MGGYGLLDLFAAPACPSGIKSEIVLKRMSAGRFCFVSSVLFEFTSF